MVLMIDACARKSSRTRRLADAVVSQKLAAGETLKKEVLYELYEADDLRPLSEQEIALRDRALAENDFADPYFDRAKTFAAADTIIIAAPYWDLSFPAILKLYLEQVCVNGVTFRYSDVGVPFGLCQAADLYYVTTAGGEIGALNFGYDYIRALTTGLLGVKKSHCIRAVALDIEGTDTETVLKNATEHLAEMLG